MAYKSCAAKIAASIQQDCNKPLVGGYTGRAVIMSVLDFMRAEVVRSADNPRKIMSVVLPPDGSVMAYTVDNVFAAPFTGSTTAGNNDNGRNGYLKTVSVRVPMRGADVSKDVIEPLVKDPNGFVAIVEKRDKVGDGSYEVVGYQNALRGDIAGVTRDESANGGDWIVPLTTIEKWAEVTLVGSAETYESAKKEFEGLFGFDVNIIRFVFEQRSDTISLAANGIVWIDTIKAGQLERLKLTSLNTVNETQVILDSDVGTEVVVYGEVTKFNAVSTIRNLDVSNCKTLKVLSCVDCQGITSLDVSKNTELTELICGYCQLSSLDVSKNTALIKLGVEGNRISSLDVSHNHKLTYLSCNNCTGLTSLDLSKNAALTYLVCYSCTGLTSLDLSKNASLTELNCNGCTGLTSLDVSKNIALTFLGFDGCENLQMLNIKNTQALEDGEFFDQSMTNLTTLQVAGTSAWAYEQVESWLSGDSPNEGKLYVDENTPQAVITAAEAKDWEVIYRS